MKHYQCMAPMCGAIISSADTWMIDDCTYCGACYSEIFAKLAGVLDEFKGNEETFGSRLEGK